MGASVLVCDSGLGGLTVLDEIRALRPDLTCHYLADAARFPYGAQPADALADALPGVIAQAVDHVGADCVVMACNTASTLALDKVRDALDIPVVGTVPAVKPAAELAEGRPIAVLGTPLTVRSPYLDRLIADFAGESMVIRHGSTELVALAEAKLMSGETPLQFDIRQALGILPDLPHLAAVVLACTHFPLLREEISYFLPRNTLLIDSGNAIARQTSRQLAEVTTSKAQPGMALTTGPADPRLTTLFDSRYGMALTSLAATTLARTG